MADHVTDSIIVKGNAAQVFKLWSDFENFPKFMKNIKSVDKMPDGKSHWVVEGPMGKDVEWDAEITRLEPDSRIAWATADRQGKGVKTSGQVTFQQLSHDETQVTVVMHYEPPAGVVGEIGAHLAGDPQKKLKEDLRNFKNYAEGMYDRTA